MTDYPRPFGLGPDAYFDSATAEWIDPDSESIPFAEGVELPPPTTSSQPRPDLVPGPAQGTSSPVPHPKGDEVAGVLVPKLVPRSRWERIDLIAVAASPPAPPEVANLFYRGKLHLVSGEFESGKTWVVIAAAVTELLAGRGVVWVNTDSMSAAELYERLHGFGVDDAALDRLFFLFEPASPLGEPETVALLAFIEESGVRLVVADALNSMLSLHGAKTSVTEDVEAFFRRWQPFTRAGCAVVFPDHVVKAKDDRGEYAYGSERKVTGTQVHLGLKAFPKLRRGERGKVRLTVFRDRVGFLHQNPPGVFVLDSSESGAYRFWFEQGTGTNEGGTRPTYLMEKVSDYVKRYGRPCTRKQIDEDVEGKAEWIRKAITLLVQEGYFHASAGKHGARLVESIRPYCEADDLGAVGSEGEKPTA